MLEDKDILIDNGFGKKIERTRDNLFKAAIELIGDIENPLSKEITYKELKSLILARIYLEQSLILGKKEATCFLYKMHESHKIHNGNNFVVIPSKTHALSRLENLLKIGGSDNSFSNYIEIIDKHCELYKPDQAVSLHKLQTAYEVFKSIDNLKLVMSYDDQLECMGVITESSCCCTIL